MGQPTRFAALLLLLLCAAVEVRADEAAVKDFLRAYADAFNKQDIEAVSAMWAGDASHVDRETGERTEGRAAIREDLAEVFKNPAKTHLTGTVDHVRFINPDTAQAEGTTTTSVPGEQPSVLQFSAILVRQGEKWQIKSVEEMPVPTPTAAYDALGQLEWLEGSWTDNSTESPVVSTFRWSANGTFLIRLFSTKEGEEVIPLGTQIIGWDPRSQEIRSWTFNSDGSFGDGVWSKVDNDWLIQSTQTLADGREASGTYVVSRVDENTVTLKLVGREIEGEPSPASEPVSLVRVPAANQPAQAAPQPPKQQ